MMHPAAQASSQPDTAAEAPRILHITNGDSAAGSLRQSALPGDVSIWADVLYEGPVPAGNDDDRWRQARATYLADGNPAQYEEALHAIHEWEDAVDRAHEYDEVILWFEHDLFDQLNLIHLLDRLSRRPEPPNWLTLISVGAFPGVDRFVGLGQLTPDQLESLIDVRAPVSREQTTLARTAWDRFRSDDPRELEALVAGDTSALPFLGAALTRHLEEYPSAYNGLSRTEHELLHVLDARACTAGELFRAVQDREERPFMGDLSFFRILRELARGREPLVTWDAPPRAGTTASAKADVRVTEVGRDVLEGHVDHVRLNGVDRWLGGVHLTGTEIAWRWDSSKGRLVSRTIS